MAFPLPFFVVECLHDDLVVGASPCRLHRVVSDYVASWWAQAAYDRVRASRTDEEAQAVYDKVHRFWSTRFCVVQIMLFRIKRLENCKCS